MVLSVPTSERVSGVTCEDAIVDCSDWPVFVTCFHHSFDVGRAEESRNSVIMPTQALLFTGATSRKFPAVQNHWK